MRHRSNNSSNHGIPLFTYWDALIFILLLSLVFITCTPASAQNPNRKVMDLRAEYGLNELQSKLQVKNLFSTQAAAQAKYPSAWADWQARGKSAAAFMELSAADAAASDAVWRGNGGTGTLGQWPDSKNPLMWPQGTYAFTISALASEGDWIGMGSGYQDVNNTSINTKFIPWHDKWQGDPSERVLVIVGPWGKSGAYQVGGGLQHIGLDGDPEGNPAGVRTIGIRAWSSTETQYYDDLMIGRCSVGMEVFNPTPTRMGLLSVSGNIECGLRSVGGWGGTLEIDVLSGDDNGKLFEQVTGYNFAGGGGVNIGTIKDENGGRSVAAFGPHRSNIIDLTGNCRFNVGNLWCHTGDGIRVDGMIVVRPAGGLPLVVNVGVYGMSGNCANIVHQVKSATHAGKAWGNTNKTTGVALTYDSQENGGAVKINGNGQTATTRNCTDALGWVVGSTFPNASTCTPAYFTVGYGGTVPPPPPPPVDCAFTYSAWTTCTGTQTRTYTSTPAGCVGVPPPDSLSRTCTVTPPPPPPPTSGGIDPNDVLVAWNTSDSQTKAWADAYAAAWGIPSGNVVSVTLGISDNLTSASQLTSAKTTIDQRAKQYTMLAFRSPSRYNTNQSITSAITFGVRTVTSLTVSALYGYTGTKPRTDKGVAPSSLLISPEYIRRDAHGTSPQGSAINLLAKDAPSQGNPRGSARAAQTTTGVTVWDSRPISGIGGGQNPCNNIANECWLTARKPTPPIVAYYGSIYLLEYGTDVTWRKGFYGDHVTSCGGLLTTAANFTNTCQQTSLQWHLAHGASLSVGTVVEPWQAKSGNSPGSMVEQFVNVTMFHPLFIGGKAVGVAAWSAVKCPDRALFAGDLMCAPYLKP